MDTYDTNVVMCSHPRLIMIIVCFVILAHNGAVGIHKSDTGHAKLTRDSVENTKMCESSSVQNRTRVDGSWHAYLAGHIGYHTHGFNTTSKITHHCDRFF